MTRILDRLATVLGIWWVMRRVYGDLPLRPERNPLEFVLFVAMFVGTVGIALGRRGLPNSLAETPNLFGQSAAAFIVCGAAVAAIGIIWVDEEIRLLFEQLGLTFLGFGLLCYGAALVSASTWDQASIAASLSWGVALGTGARWAHISWYFRQQPPARPPK